MKKFPYPRIAASSIKNNGTYYLPYILSASGMIALFYIVCAIIFDNGFEQLPGFSTLNTILFLGVIVIALFSAGFLFYVNNFLMKRRKKELGLYNILGMEKRHIGIILFFESIFVFLISFLLGIVSGVLFSRLVSLLLLKMVHFETPLNFSISLESILISFAVFGLVFLLLLLFNFGQLKLNNPVELLKSQNVGEKEPKTKILMTLLGLISLGSGYWIAITTETPLKALGLFFIAVILVIIGTYLLFTAGSIALLKLLRKNKRYYYKPKNFTSVSGMMYRMKKNSAGLASICILSTMVLVTISTTVSLYIGASDILNQLQPNDMVFSVCNPPEGEKDEIIDLMVQTVEEKNLNIKNLEAYSYLYNFSAKVGNTYTGEQNSPDIDDYDLLQIITADSYNEIAEENLHLKDGELYYYSETGDLPDDVNFFGKPYNVRGEITENPFEGPLYNDDVNAYLIVIGGGEQALEELQDLRTKSGNITNIYFKIRLDTDGSDNEKIECFEAISSKLVERVDTISETLDEESDYSYFISLQQSKQENKREFFSVYGGLLFLGIFLGLLFLTATVLIIYYKQISEGYEDRKRFEIMQKVGLSRREIWKTIKSQVLKVFFIPIVMTTIHILAAFGMITKVLYVFSLTDTRLFAICTAACIGVFFLFYTAVYALTTKAYYKIAT